MIEELQFQPSTEPKINIKLWSPRTIRLVTFFLGFPSGTVLASINWFRMGMKRKAFISIVAAIACLVAMIVFIPDNLFRGLALIANLLWLILVPNKMEEDIELLTKYEVEGPPWFSGCLASAVGLILFFTVFFTIGFLPNYYYYSHGNNHLNQGEYEEAIESYNTAIKLDRADSFSYTNRGFAFTKLGKTDRALLDFNKSIELNPKDFFAYNNRGQIFYLRKDYDRAIDDYSRAIEINPDDPLAYYNRALAHRDHGEYGDAISDLTSVIRLLPNDSEAYFERAYVNMTISNFNGAISDYTRIIQFEPTNARAYYFRGIAYAWLGQTLDARKDFERALEFTGDVNFQQEIKNRLEQLPAE